MRRRACVAAPPAVVSSVASASATPRKKTYAQTWDEPTYEAPTSSDKVDGEDLEDPPGRRGGSRALQRVRRCGGSEFRAHFLTIVNQPLALSGGFQPCSTVKVSVALAALREGLVKRTSPIKFASRNSLDLTDALAYSNNYYFANLGIQLGYEQMNYYAHLFGYGEKAGLNIEGEKPGAFPLAPRKMAAWGCLPALAKRLNKHP